MGMISSTFVPSTIATYCPLDHSLILYFMSYYSNEVVLYNNNITYVNQKPH